MLSIQRLGTASETMVKYYTDLASATQYYMDDAEPAGIWHGKLAARQGLLGKSVEHETLMLYASGFDKRGNRLVTNAGEGHQMGQDLVFSAPKSVSVLFGLADETVREKIQAAQLKAVKFALDYAERHILGIRISDNKDRVFLNTANAMFAVFEHGSTRRLDPGLHHHAVLMNLSERSPDNIQCIETKNLYGHKKALGAMYRAELAHQLVKSLGVEIIEDEEFFKLGGVPDELCTLFSKRSDDIKEALDQGGFGLANSRMKDNAALYTRDKKRHHSRRTLYDSWKKEAELHLPGYRLEIGNGHKVPSADLLKTFKAEILEAVVENHSVFERCDLIEVTQRYAQWSGVGAKAAVDYIGDLLKDEEVVTIQHPVLGKCYTTQQQMRRERYFYECAIASSRKQTHWLDEDDIASSANAKTLNDEQQVAFDTICSNSGNVVTLQGAPGVGKSFLMGAVAEVYSHAGYRLQGCALAGSAADELSKSSGIESQTIDSLLRELEVGKKSLKKNTLLVVDEVGMVGVNKLSELLEYAFRAESKIILLGDVNQLPAIQAGAAFHRLMQYINPLELKQIKRQRNKQDRENVKKIGDGEIKKVLEYLDENNLFNFQQDHITCKMDLVQDWYSKATFKMPETIMMATTRKDVSELNQLARTKLKAMEKLPSTQIIVRNHNNEPLELSEGERVMFRQNSRELEVKNGTLGNITSLKKLRANSIHITVLTDEGKTVEFKLADYNALDYGYAMSVHKSQGKTVDHAFLWLNDRFINQELTYVGMSRSRQTTKVYAASSTQSRQEYLKSLAFLANRKTAKYEFWDDPAIPQITGDLEPILF